MKNKTKINIKYKQNYNSNIKPSKLNHKKDHLPLSKLKSLKKYLINLNYILSSIVNIKNNNSIEVLIQIKNQNY